MCDHEQSVTAYCVPDDNGECIRFESHFVPFERVS